MSYPITRFESRVGIEVIEVSIRVGLGGEQEADILTREAAEPAPLYLGQGFTCITRCPSWTPAAGLKWPPGGHPSPARPGWVTQVQPIRDSRAATAATHQPDREQGWPEPRVFPDSAGGLTAGNKEGMSTRLVP